MMYLLEANNVHKRFGNFTAVKGVSLTVAAGECVALLGPNGAGKTTTFEMFEGLIESDSGEIKLFEKTWRESRRDILPRIGVQLQETSLYKRFTVTETLKLFASFYHKTIPIHELLNLVGLEDKANSQLKDLSGGQKQRVYLAAAIINQPDLIFLDEPTTGLDPAARRGIWQIIETLKRKGVGILLSSHYMEEAQHLADRVAIMHQGEIIALGTTDELIQNYAKNDTQKLDHEEKKIPLNEPIDNQERNLNAAGTLEQVFLALTGRKIDHD